MEKVERENIRIAINQFEKRCYQYAAETITEIKRNCRTYGEVDAAINKEKGLARCKNNETRAALVGLLERLVKDEESHLPVTDGSPQGG